MRLIALSACAVGAFSPLQFGQTCFTKRPFEPAVHGFGAGDLCDLDGDGRTDAALADSYPPASSISVFEAATDATFALAVNLPLGVAMHTVRAADLDLDGDVDLLGKDFGTLWTVLNDGAGGLAAGSSTPVSGNDLAAADFDLDGDADAATISPGATGIVRDLRNDGSGVFTEVGAYSAGLASSSITAADFDNDLAPELAVTNVMSFGVSVFANDGAGVFAPGVGCGVAGQANTITSADIDGNGFRDLCVASTGNDLFNLLLNDGNGTFAPAVSLYAGAKPMKMASGDFDCDGDLDVLVGTLTEGLTLLENGPGGLTAFVGAVPTASAGPLGAVDLDGDQGLDLVLIVTGGTPAAGIRALINHNCSSAASAVTVYGTGLNPLGSMAVLAGAPRIGETLVLRLENTLGTQSAATLAFLQLASAKDPAPFGTPIPGFSMAGGGASGGLLIASPFGPPVAGFHWTVTPAFAVNLPVPFDCQILGGVVYAQGLLIDPLPAAPAPFGLTEGAEILIGGP